VLQFHTFFLTFQYMCSAFVIVCPPEEELGRCGGEPTPKQQKTANNKNDEEEMDAEEQKMMVDDVMGMNDGQLNANNAKTENKNGGGEGEAKLEEEGAVVDQQQDDDDDDIVVLLEAKKKKPVVVDRLMACTGRAANCPVHNPPDEWPRLLYYTGRDAVKKVGD
jgi:hypothetical protein